MPTRNDLPVLLIRFLMLKALVCTVAVGIPSNPLYAEDSADKKKAKVTYDDQIRPLLNRRCASCHSGDRTEGDLNIANFFALMQGGGSGAVVDAGSADDSFLFRVVNHEDSPEMPPNGQKIPSAEIKLLRDWIDQGALENATSKAKKRKSKVDLTAVSANPNARPDVAPALPRLPLEPALWTKRKSPIRAITANPWSPIVAVAAPRQVVLYDTKTLTLKGVIPFPRGKPEVLRFSRNGSILLIGGGVAGDSAAVMMWDVAKGQTIQTIGDELDSVLACDITPDHSLVALGGPKKTVRVYSTDDGTLLYELKKHTDWVTAIEFSPDGSNLASADRNGGLIVSDAQTGNENFDLAGHKEMITSLSWRTDGKILGSTSNDKTVRIWEMRKGKQVKNWAADAKGVTEICFLPSGNLLTTGRNKNVMLWQQDGKQLQAFKGLKDIGMGLAYCSSTQRVFAGSFQGDVLVWDRPNPASVGQLNANPPPISDRIVDTNQQWEEAKMIVSTHQAELQTHDTTIGLILAEILEAENDFSDMQEEIENAKTEVKSLYPSIRIAKKRLEKLKERLAKSGAVDSDGAARDEEGGVASEEELKQQQKQLKSKRKQVKELVQRMTVLNNQMVAWDGLAAAKTARIADLKNEIGRLKDQRKPLAAKLKKSLEFATSLSDALKFWKAEADFAKATGS